MLKTKELSNEQRLKIQFLYEQGNSQCEIARKVKCSRCAVQYTIKRLKNTGSHLNHGRSGRKKITTPRDDRLLKQMALKNRRKSSFQLAAELSVATRKRISAPTTRRRLVEAGLKGCKGRKKPWILEINKTKRLEWALKHRHFTEEDWAKVLRSDESNVQVFGTPGASYVKRRVDEEYKEECIVPTVKHGGGTITIWGCMAADGVGKMYICEGRMNSLTYINLLETTLQESFSRIFDDTNMDGVKLQDNATCHTFAVTMKWFSENGVDLLHSPPQSPDLNPIEQLWAFCKCKIRKHSITSKITLKFILQEEWKKTLKEKCSRLVRSMPKRMNAVIKAKGGPTKYR